MHVAILSSRASYHHIAQLLEKDSQIDKIYHFGANKSCLETDKYIPIHYDLTDHKDLNDQVVMSLHGDFKKLKIDFALSSNRNVLKNEKIHSMLDEFNTPYFFVYPGLMRLENDRVTAKDMLKKLRIPTVSGRILTGEELRTKYMELSRPFVIKIVTIYMHGRQTIIVDNDNYQRVFEELFSIHLGKPPNLLNIDSQTTVWVEDFIKLKREYSYHMLVNQKDWKFLGAARDYKKYQDRDSDFNTLGLGAYNINEVDPIVHDYAERIFVGIQNHLKTKGKFYRGFMYIGIGIDENDKPWILEINIRNGEPEIDVILPQVDNSLSNLFFECSINNSIPSVKRNDKKFVTVKLFNSMYDWTRPATQLPKILESSLPDDITLSRDTPDSENNYYINHSLLTTEAQTHKDASKKITDYLLTRELGQFTFLKDIGISI